VRKALIAIGMIVLLLIAAPFFIPSESIRIAVEGASSEALGARVSIKVLSVRLLPVPGVTIRNAVMRDAKKGLPRLKVESGSVSLALMPLFRGKIRTRRISFKNIFLRLSEKARGKAVRAIWIDKFRGAVHMGKERLKLSNWQARLYGGKLEFDAEMSPLKGKARKISGKAHIEGIQVRRLLRDAARQTKLSGTLSSDIRFSARGADYIAMKRTLHVDGPVHLQQGALHTVKLKGSALMLVPGKGKQVNIAYRKFDLLLQVRGQNIHARDIRLDSNVLDATGNVAINSRGKLDGEIKAASLGGLVGARLRVGGTIDKPLIYPDTSTLIGGAIGAGVAGPAGAMVGATVGGSIGSAVKKIGDSLKGLLGK